MKHLSRVLSLALVIALSLGLVVTAGAAVTKFEDYTDAADIKPEYAEATDVLTALGVFQGNDDNSLKPESTFTRAQAAKIVAYISIGTTAADRLSPRPSSFTDVATSHWANPFIEYAVEKGIINGVGNGRFNPEGAVTGAQLAKMLLVALGYGAKGEYVGASWEINAIVDGQTRGILTVDADYSAAAKREEAIQYTFNAIRPNGTTLAGAPLGKNFLVKYTALIDDYILANSTTFQTGTAQYIGSEVFRLDRELDEDDFGFDGHYWVVPPRRISEVFYKDGAVIAELTTNGMISRGYAYSTYKWADNLEVWTNGHSVINVPSSNYIEKGGIFPAFAGTGWNVTLLDMNYNGEIDKLVISYGYLAKVTKVNTTLETVEADFYYRDGAAKRDRKVTVDGKGFAVNDWIVITPFNDAAGNPVFQPATSISASLAVEKATVLTGRTTSYMTDKTFNGPGYIVSITVDGKVYNVASVEAITYDINGLDYNTDVVLYLDSNDYVLGYDGASVTAASLNYLYITGRAVGSGSGVGNYNNEMLGDRRLGVTYADGTKGVVEAALKSDGTFAGNNDAAAENTWFAYTLDASGKVVLKSLANVGPVGVAYGETAAADYPGSQNSFRIQRGNPQLDVGTSLTSSTAITAGYATSSTILRIGGRTYTGYANFPDYSAKNNDSLLVIFTQDNTAARAPTTTIAAIYVAATGSVKSGEYGIISMVGNSVATGWQYTVITKAEPAGVTLVHPDDLSGVFKAGDVVEIISAATGGERTIGERETTIGTGVITAVDGAFTYIRFDATLYYLAGDVLFLDVTQDAASRPREGDVVSIYGDMPNSTSAPAFAVVKTTTAAALHDVLQASITAAESYLTTVIPFADPLTVSFAGALGIAKGTNPTDSFSDLTTRKSALDSAVEAYVAALETAKTTGWNAYDNSQQNSKSDEEGDITTALGVGYLAATGTFVWEGDRKTVTVKFADGTELTKTLTNAYT
jgi:hypothetical protein